jgi:hypothetical protein
LKEKENKLQEIENKNKTDLQKYFDKTLIMEKKIKESKIQLFGDENASLDFYKKNKDIYNTESLKRIENIVRLLELLDEYEFIKKSKLNNEGKKIANQNIEEKISDIEDKNNIKDNNNENMEDNVLDSRKSGENSDSKRNYRKTENLEAGKKSQKQQSDEKNNRKLRQQYNKSVSLEQTPPQLDSKYVAVSNQDTILEKNRIVVNRNLK